MGLDRRTFLSTFSLAPAATLVGVSACQPAEHDAPASPLVKALREVTLADAVEPAITFVPLRRKS